MIEEENDTVDTNVFNTGNAKEFAQRLSMGESSETILQSLKERKPDTLEMVTESCEISWIKSVGECEAFIMASMFQQHVQLARIQGSILEHLNGSLLGNVNPTILEEIRTNYDYVSNLVEEHEDRMDTFKSECQERRKLESKNKKISEASLGSGCNMLNL